MSVRDIDMGYNNLKDMVMHAHADVEVGYWPGEFTEENGTDLAVVAAQNDAGAWENGVQVIPERPFMRGTFDENEREIEKRYAREFDRMAKSGRGGRNSDKIMMRLGAWFTGMVKRKIQMANIWATPLSPITIAQKGSTHPLFDTGQLLNKIDYREAV